MEYFWIQVSHVSSKSMQDAYPPRYGVFSVIPFKVLVRVGIVFPKLLDDVLAHVAIILLDFRRHFHLVLGRNGRHLAAFP